MQYDRRDLGQIYVFLQDHWISCPAKNTHFKEHPVEEIKLVVKDEKA